MSELEINPVAQVQQFKHTTNLTSLTKFLKTMLFVFLGTSFLMLISDTLQMGLLSGDLTSMSQAAIAANDNRQQLIAVINVLAYIVTGITFLIWIYRANKNCHGFGAQGMKFTPGWSIGWYFIPVVNWFKPYSSMKEIWKVSSNPANWQAESGSTLLGWWWALWLTSGYLGQTSFRLYRMAESITMLQVSTAVSILGGLAALPLCLVAVSLIQTIYSKQEQLVNAQS